MDENEVLKYIEKIVLEILDRPRFWLQQWNDRRTKKWNIGKFNAKEAAYAFLRQYNQQSFVKAQKIIVWYNNQELHLCVRDLIYGKINKTSNSSVEFIYRNAMFSEIRWPVVTVNRTNRVRWARQYNEKLIDIKKQVVRNRIKEIHTNNDDDVSSINVDEPIDIDTQGVPSMSNNNVQKDDQVLSESFQQENIMNSTGQEFQTDRSIFNSEKLVNNNEEGSVIENDHRYRTSIHIQVNQYNNSE